MSEPQNSTRHTTHCVECDISLSYPGNRGDKDENDDWVCTDPACRRSHDAVIYTDNESPPTGEDLWELNNRQFSYEPPQKPADAWSQEEQQELYDRVIRRNTDWLCQECTGHGPMNSLEQARRHVQNKHGYDLLEKHAPDRDELETENTNSPEDNVEQSKVEQRAEENHGLSTFSNEGNDE